MNFNISYKTFQSKKSLHICLDNIHGFIKIDNRIVKFFVLLEHNEIYYGIKLRQHIVDEFY